MKVKSAHAQVAQLCKKFVKSLGLECTAKSSTFSGGDSVTVRIEDASFYQRRKIDQELAKYAYGRFSAERDIYEMDSGRDDIPQVKYIHPEFRYSPKVKAEAWAWIRETHGPSYFGVEALPEVFIEDDPSLPFDVRMEVSQTVWHVLNREDFWKSRACVASAALTAPSAAVENSQVHEVFHTRMGVNVFIATIGERVSREAFNELLGKARSLGGWYSKAWGSSPSGFAFKTRELVEQFLGEATEHSNAEPAPFRQPKAAQSKAKDGVKAAEKLRAIAKKASADAAAKLADRNTNTPKRMVEAMRARLEGHRLERTSKAALALAELWEAGAVPAEFEKYTTKAAIYAAVMSETELAGRGYYNYHVETGRPAESADKALWDLAATGGGDKLRVLLNNVRHAGIAGYFPTPKAVQDRLRDLLSFEIRDKESVKVLEPSAGSGNLADMAREIWPKACIETYEVNPDLAHILTVKGYAVEQVDFTGVEPDASYDVVVMNPPFENGQDMRHIEHAFKFLKEGGELVAICSPFDFKTTKAAVQFKAWLGEVGAVWESLPSGSFKESGTSVGTVVVYAKRGE